MLYPDIRQKIIDIRLSLTFQSVRLEVLSGVVWELTTEFAFCFHNSEIAARYKQRKQNSQRPIMKKSFVSLVFAIILSGLLLASNCQSGNKAYDLHVYFFKNNVQQKAYATRLMQEAVNQWSDLRIKMFEDPVGPHPLPMFEIDIPQDYPKFSDIVSWIMVNHGNLSALLHPHTGNQWNDHTNYSLWLGQPVPLDLSKL